MTDQREDLASPCNGVCTLDTVTGWCLGCQRTIDEIASWSRASDAQKRHILGAAERRRATVESGTAPVNPATLEHAHVRD